MTSSEIVMLRARRKWSQPDLARALGIHVRTVKRWEDGDCIPSGMALKQLQRLAAPPPVQPPPIPR